MSVQPIDFKSLLWPEPVAIIGLGLSGRSVLRLLKAAGYKSLLTFDSSDVQADIKNPEDLIKQNPRTLVVSPGVPLKTPWIQALKNKGVIITSELTVAAKWLTTEKVVGITGSVGKSTVVSLLEAGLKTFSPESFVGGNLGRPLADYVYEAYFHHRSKATWLILELSSYQLENLEGIVFCAGAITSLTPNHLERYDSLHEYYKSKWELAKKIEGPLIINDHSRELKKFAEEQMAPPRTQLRSLTEEIRPLSPFQLQHHSLLGRHNFENLNLAASLSLILGWPLTAFEGMKRFKGLSHRLENLGKVKGVLFVNDSKATTMESVKMAVTSLQDLVISPSHLFLLLGGKDKNLPWQQLSDFKSHPCLEVCFFGQCRSIAQTLSQLEGSQFETLGQALQTCWQKSRPGDLILLSPGGTSLDEFKSFEARGDFFKAFVSTCDN